MTAPFVPRSVAPRLPVRMIVLDIDGTLVDDDVTLRDRTVHAIRRARRAGIRVSLVTGRMTFSAIQFAILLELTDPVIGMQGGLIREMPVRSGELGRMLRHRPLEAAAARDAVVWTRARGFAPHINHLERLVIPTDDPEVDDYSAFLGIRATRVDDLAGWIRHPISKLVAVGPPGLPAGSLAEARLAFANRADVTVAHPRFLEFVAPGVSKGAAVRWLARRQRIELGAVVAIGDQLNDLEMLAAVGHGAAMPHAPAAVLEAARYVAPPLEEEGAAQVIERLALAGGRATLAASRAMAAEAAGWRLELDGHHRDHAEPPRIEGLRSSAGGARQQRIGDAAPRRATDGSAGHGTGRGGPR